MAPLIKSLGLRDFLVLEFLTQLVMCAGYPLGTVGIGWTTAACSLPTSHSGMFSISASEMLISSRAGAGRTGLSEWILKAAVGDWRPKGNQVSC